MFWMWNSEMSYMDCEWGQAESQTDKLDQLLFQVTLWGTYHGSSIERFHYDYLLENAPDAVEVIEIGHGGKGLILNRSNLIEAGAHTQVVMELISAMARTPEYTPDYPIYDDDLYCSWEMETIEKEMMGYYGQGWMEDLQDALEDITDWDATLIPEVGSEKFWELYTVLTENEVPYWEGADSLVLPTYDAEEIVAGLLAEYAAEMVPSQDSKLFN